MNSENHHYIPQFYLRMFSCNPKASKSKQELFYLCPGKDIDRELIKNICTYPGFNTEEQENILSRIENELAPSLRHLVKSQTFTDDSKYMMKKLTSLLIAGSLRFRLVYSQMEDALLVLGNDFEKYFTRAYRIKGGLGITILCAEKIHEELNNNYQTMLLLTSKIDSFITSDSPVVFHAKETHQDDYIIDFSDMDPTPTLDENTNKISGLNLSYKIERIRIPATVLYVPLSSRTLLILIDNKKLQCEIVSGRQIVSGHEINRLNKRIFGRCMLGALASSESLLQKYKGVVSRKGGGIITTYTDS